jgi:hypothetical protein
MEGVGRDKGSKYQTFHARNEISFSKISDFFAENEGYPIVFPK